MKQLCILSIAALGLAACTPVENGQDTADDMATPAPSVAENPAAGTRPSGQPNLITVSGVLEAGRDCMILRTAESGTYAFNQEDPSLRPGDRVSITGEIADAAYCMEGDNTLIPFEITKQ